MATASGFAAQARATARTRLERRGLPRSRCSSGSRRPGWRGAPPTPAAGTPCRECRAAGPATVPGASTRATDRRHQMLEAGVGADEPGVGEAVLEIAHECVGIVAEQDGAHARRRRRDQDRAERALADGETDLAAGAAGAVGPGRHAEDGRRLGVEPAAGIVAGVVAGGGHRRSLGSARPAAGSPGAPRRRPAASPPAPA